MRIDIRTNFDDFQKWLGTHSTTKVAKVKRLVLSTALDIQRGAKEKLRANGSIDVGMLRNSVIVELDSGGLTAEVGAVESTAKYAPYVEYGTGPRGKYPPLNALKHWADKHGIPVFLVARKIKEKGTPARPFLGPAADAILPFFEQDLAAVLEKDEGSDSGGSSKALL